MNLYALIMAGGSGTRLWPRSRRDKPKQLLDIVSQRTMLQGMCERIRPLIPDERIFVITGEHVGVETTRSLVYSPHRLVATVGVEDMVIVDTDDAILVCPKDRAQEVRSLVDELKKSARDKYL